MAHPISLGSLTPREAVADALYRCVIGIDANDRSLFDSAWVRGEDACFEISCVVSYGLDAIRDKVFTPIGPLDTTHHISNIRMQMQEGADTAYMTAYALAQHIRPEEGPDLVAKDRVTIGSMYFIDAVKDGNDGVWKKKKFRMKIIWVEGDRSVLRGR